MPKIPGLPTLDPVAQPYISPQEAGRPGMAIAQLGEEDTDIALGGLALQEHIRKAQGQVDRLAAGNELEKLWQGYQDDLRKTTDSRQIDTLKQQWQSKLNDLSKSWAQRGSPDAIQIGLMADSYRPSMDHLGTVRQADLASKEFDAQTKLQIQSVLPQYVTAMREGDTKAAASVMDHLGATYDEAIRNGLATPSDKAIAINAFQINARKDLNDAIINSANQVERQQAIDQLRTGGKGPLDLTSYTPGDLSATRIYAEDQDKKLNNLAESRNQNTVLNNMHAMFSFPEYQNNPDGRMKAVQDGEFLKRIGAVTPDGQPDRVMGEKLEEEVSRENAYQQKQQDDLANDFLNKVSPLIDEDNMSLSQLNEALDQSGLSGKALVNARRAAVAQWRQNYNINKQLSLADRQQAERERDDLSASKYADILGAIATGKMYTPAEIRQIPELTSKDKTQLILAAKSTQDDPGYAAAMDMLNDTLPRLKTGTTQQLAERDLDYRLTQQRFQQRVNENPKEDKAKVMRDVLEPAVQKDIANRINQILGVPPAPPTLSERIKGLAQQHPAAARFFGIPTTPPDAAPEADRTDSGTGAPKEGDTKQNRAGDNLVYEGGRWVLVPK